MMHEIYTTPGPGVVVNAFKNDFPGVVVPMAALCGETATRPPTTTPWRLISVVATASGLRCFKLRPPTAMMASLSNASSQYGVGLQEGTGGA